MRATIGVTDQTAEFELGKPAIPVEEILQYLKDHGDRLDSEIVTGTGIALENVCLCLAKLSDRGDVVMCRTTRYSEGRQVEGMLCRVSGYFPRAAPGRKPGAPTS
ncbi:MAG: ArsR family transcriptional regulator [Gallionellaceae bacterium]|nr:ArsR family transcriptional regulator [Gallionellaceae bacterium]